jgi:hypothetical protein
VNAQLWTGGTSRTAETKATRSGGLGEDRLRILEVASEHMGLLVVAATVLRHLDPEHVRRFGGEGTNQREMSNPAASIAAMRSRAQRCSTESAPPCHCQGSEAAFSSSH